MSALLCGRAACKNELVVPAQGPKPTYCSDACRKAVARGAAQRVSGLPAATTPPDVSSGADVRGSAPRPSRTGYRQLLCPVDPTHGRLLDWPTDRWAFYCPAQAHEGYRDRPATRAFFTTAEAEHGLAPASPAGPDDPAPSVGAPQRQPDQGQREASVPPADASTTNGSTQPTTTVPVVDPSGGAQLRLPIGAP